MREEPVAAMAWWIVGTIVVAALVVSAVAPPAEGRTGVLLTADGPPRPPAGAARYRNWDCVFTGGPEYTWAVGTTGKRWKSTTYLLRGFGSTCAFAKKWVRRLAKEPYTAGRIPRPRTPALHHGPKGWRCQGKVISPNQHPLTSFHGVCQNRRNKGRVFSWEPQSGYDDGPVDPPTLPPDPAPEP
jgi:hypothetical protein